MDRDVQGRNPFPDNPLDIPPAQVGQGDVIAVEKGKAVIIVLDIEGLPQIWRLLVNKAEDALIAALSGPQLKFQPQIFLVVLFDFILQQLAGTGLHPDAHFLTGDVKVVVQDIPGLMTVEGEDAVSGH